MNYEISLSRGPLKLTAKSSLPHEIISKRNFDKLIILLHGFPDTNQTYAELVPFLKKEYKNALFVAPALRGYEKSSLGGKYDYCMYEVASDIKEWICLLSGSSNTPVYIVGHDWGAIVAYKTASLYPELVTLMTTLAIPYLTNLSLFRLLFSSPFALFRQLWLLSYMIVMQIRMLYQAKFQGSYLSDLWRFWSPTWKFTTKQLAEVSAVLGDPAVLDGATAYYRCVVIPKNWKQIRWHVPFDSVPTLIIGGMEDGCMLSQFYEIEKRLLISEPNAKVQLIDNAGHFMHREKPEVVANAIIDWFNAHT